MLLAAPADLVIMTSDAIAHFSQSWLEFFQRYSKLMNSFLTGSALGFSQKVSSHREGALVRTPDHDSFLNSSPSCQSVHAPVLPMTFGNGPLTLAN